MRGIFSSSGLVLALLCLDVASVSARRNSTRSLARRRSGKHRRACTTTALPTTTSTPSSSSTDSVPTSTGAPPAPSQGSIIQSDFLCNGKPSGATATVDTTVGPNGEEDWLNCGLDGDGWNPPPLTVDQIIYVPLDKALEDPSSPFHACEKYVDTFNKYADQLNIPATFIASFALQESGCNPSTTGGAGEVGLMQITPDKCVDPPNGDCHDVDYNVKIGATYFADQLKDNDGNVLLTIGTYNGWYPNMTKDKVLGTSNPCWQQNMDYMMDFLNLQNIDAYGDKKFGEYHNYDKCTGA